VGRDVRIERSGDGLTGTREAFAIRETKNDMKMLVVVRQSLSGGVCEGPPRTHSTGVLGVVRKDAESDICSRHIKGIVSPVGLSDRNCTERELYSRRMFRVASEGL
jgi:hypothetical protein